MKTYVGKTAEGKEGVTIPEAVWVTFFSMAFTHARAILARSSSGTRFMTLLMPVINAEQEFRKMFGKHFETGTA